MATHFFLLVDTAFSWNNIKSNGNNVKIVREWNHVTRFETIKMNEWKIAIYFYLLFIRTIYLMDALKDDVIFWKYDFRGTTNANELNVCLLSATQHNIHRIRKCDAFFLYRLESIELSNRTEKDSMTSNGFFFDGPPSYILIGTCCGCIAGPKYLFSIIVHVSIHLGPQTAPWDAVQTCLQYFFYSVTKYSLSADYRQFCCQPYRIAFFCFFHSHASDASLDETKKCRLFRQPIAVNDYGFIWIDDDDDDVADSSCFPRY